MFPRESALVPARQKKKNNDEKHNGYSNEYHVIKILTLAHFLRLVVACRWLKNLVGTLMFPTKSVPIQYGNQQKLKNVS